MPSNKPISLSVKAIVRDDQSRWLLLKRSKSSKSNAGRWDLPGGKMDACERVDQAIIREICEETGLDVAIIRVVGASESESPERRIAYLIFECAIESGEVRLSDEHEEYAWVECKDLPSMDIIPQFRAIAQDYCNRTK